MIVREYRRILDSTLARLSERSLPRITAWSKRWFGETVSVDDVRWSRLSDSIAPQNVLSLEMGGIVRGCVGADPELFDRLTQMMLSAAEPATHTRRPAYAMWSKAVALDAVADLVNGFFEGSTESESAHRDSSWSGERSIPPEFILPGAGSLTLEARVGSSTLKLYLNGALVGTLAPPPKTVPPLRSGPLNGRVGPAISGEAIRIAATTAITMVPLDSLQGLTVGDVVILDHSIDEPLMIRTAPGVAAGTAYLGTTHGRRAVRLTT